MKKNEGFTLIELLMVIAIIGILSTIVLSSLSTAREKGADALVMTNLSSLSSQAEIVFDEAFTYGSVCADARIINSLETAALKSTGTSTSYVCSDEDTTWVASVPLAQPNQVNDTSGIDYWCTRNAGGGELLDTQIAADAITC